MKTCTACGRTKPLIEFYKGAAKCKPCVRSAVMARREIKLQDPAWVAKERERCRIKQARRWAAGIKYQPSAEVRRRWLDKNKHKRRAQSIAGGAIKRGRIQKQSHCSDCGASGVELEAHHPDYSQPLQVQWLCTKCHGKTRWKQQAA